MLSVEATEYIAIGSVLGLTAGISPGPMLTLVLTQTLKYNHSEGIKVAITPLITDLPIIFLTSLVFYELSRFNTILGVIALMGGGFLVWLGYGCFRIRELSFELQEPKSESIKKGIAANFLNPHPYLFWATIGTPYIFKAFDIGLATAVLFLASFYTLLVGSKIVLALIASRSKVLIGQKLYPTIMKVLGIALFVLAIMFLYEGIKYLFPAFDAVP